MNVVFNDPETFIDGYTSTTITWGSGCSVNPDTVISLSSGSVSGITLNPAGSKAVCTSAPTCKINGAGAGATCSTIYAGGNGHRRHGWLRPARDICLSNSIRNPVTLTQSGASAIASSMLSTITAGGACSVTGTTVTVTGGGTCLLTASWPADANFLAASATQSVVPVKAISALSWPAPGAISYGTVLSSTQLNATATSNGTAVAGTFSYMPPAGTILAPGHQTLSVSFSPSYGMGYTTATTTVPLTVTPATPKIVWARPATINYGTVLSAAQLNATASIPGTFVYTPASGTVIGAGNPDAFSDFHTRRRCGLHTRHHHHDDQRSEGDPGSHLDCAFARPIWHCTRQRATECHGVRTRHLRLHARLGSGVDSGNPDALRRLHPGRLN